METGQLVLCDTFDGLSSGVGLALVNDPEMLVELRQELLRQGFNLVTSQQVEENHALMSSVHAAVGHFLGTPRLNKLLPVLPNLRHVSFPSSGIGIIDVQHCMQAKISIGNVSPVMSDFVADFAMTLILSAARRLMPGVQIARSGKTGCRLPDYGFHVKGSTLGIVGMGAIGYEVAKRGYRGFDLKVRYCNRNKRSPEDEVSVGAEYYPSVHDMLPGCDVVLLSCPLTAETRGMFGRKEFSIMKNTALLVNVGRGGLVNQEELMKALQTRQIGQAALDVTDPEPLPEDHPLLHMDNVIVTPHMASETQCTQEKVIDMTIDNLKRGLQRKPLVSGINTV